MQRQRIRAVASKGLNLTTGPYAPPVNERAHELTAQVDAAFAKVLARLRGTPAPAPTSSRTPRADADADVEGIEREAEAGEEGDGDGNDSGVVVSDYVQRRVEYEVGKMLTAQAHGVASKVGFKQTGGQGINPAGVAAVIRGASGSGGGTAIHGISFGSTTTGGVGAAGSVRARDKNLARGVLAPLGLSAITLIQQQIKQDKLSGMASKSLKAALQRRMDEVMADAQPLPQRDALQPAPKPALAVTVGQAKATYDRLRHERAEQERLNDKQRTELEAAQVCSNRDDAAHCN